LEVLDYKQYRVDMKTANLNQEKLEYNLAYEFKKEYNLTAINPEQMSLLNDRIFND